jgi:hypothetical protein
VTSLLVIDRTNLTTGFALKVIGGKEGKRKREKLEELERDTEILKEVLKLERKTELIGQKFNKLGNVRIT